MDQSTLTELEAAAFRRLVKHLQTHPEIQNINLMIYGDFCRNCLSKWMAEEAGQRDIAIEDDWAREYVYGMPYAKWKAQHQLEATPEQLAAFKAKQDLKNPS